MLIYYATKRPFYFYICLWLHSMDTFCNTFAWLLLFIYKWYLRLIVSYLFSFSGLLVTYLYFKSIRTDGSEKGRRNKTPTCGANVQKFFKLVGYRFLRLIGNILFLNKNAFFKISLLFFFNSWNFLINW